MTNRYVTPTLKDLVNRIRKDEELIRKHPDAKDKLEKRIETQKKYIVMCVLENEDNPFLEQIRIKGV